MDTIIYHRADNDGWCSAAIAKHALETEAHLIGYDYGDDFPWEEVDSHHDVVMVDISFELFDDMIRLEQSCQELIWIDHHRTAINKAAKRDFKPHGIRREGSSACELAWEYFFPDKKIPGAVKLLGRYDVFDLDFHPNVLPFEMGMRLRTDLNPQNSEAMAGWLELFSSEHSIRPLQSALRAGAVVIDYQDQWYARVMDRSFVLKWEGKTFVAVNCPYTGSRSFDSVFSPTKHDARLSYYQRADGGWSVSMYSTPEEGVDLSGIAQKHGGGGHPGACGFTCSVLPWSEGTPPYDGE